MKARQFRTLDDWLNWQQQLHPKNIDFKIERIKSVYKKLNISKIAKKIIIVAGTNGKGSTVAILESILHEAKYKVGSFTSPHILDYNERIKVSKETLNDEKIIQAFEVINEIRGNTTLTYFEFATLAAFYIFSKSDLDYAILEVGLGGRLDATNIINSDISIITSIGIDHTEFLGTSINSIAYEKAGVMRPFCYSIYAGVNPPSALMTHAAECKANFIHLQNEFSHKIYSDHWVWKSRKGQEYSLPLLPLTGDFQYNHASASLQCLEILQEDVFTDLANLKNGINNITLLGRYQIWSRKPEVIIDVAHNEDSALKLFDNINKEEKKKTFAVIGLLNDKDVYSLIKPLSNIIEKWYVGTINSDRGMNSNEIKERMKSLVDNNNIICANTMTEAFTNAYSQLNENDRLIVYGSFYTVSEFLNYSREVNKKISNE